MNETTTKVIECTCKSEFQDKTYGVSKRLHNYALKANGGKGGYRCTVCKTVK
jgi:hypothetical protein